MLTKDDKRAIIDLLKRLNIIEPEHTGQIVVNLNQGGVTSVQVATLIK